MKPRLLLDLDGVLADFDKAAAALWGLTVEELNSRRGETPTWDITPLLGVSHTEFWKRIAQNEYDFWLSVDPLPWAEELVDHVASITDDWYIVTTPSHSGQSHRAKFDWCHCEFLKKYMDEHKHFDRYIPTKHKHLLAREGAILIDDREQNCNHFVFGPKMGASTGGTAILFPAIGNFLREYANDPLPYVKEGLAALLGNNNGFYFVKPSVSVGAK